MVDNNNNHNSKMFINPLYNKSNQSSKKTKKLTTGLQNKTFISGKSGWIFRQNESKVREINMLSRELFLTFVLKRHPPTAFDKNGKIISSTKYNRQTILNELIQVATVSKVHLCRESQFYIVNITERRLSHYVEIKNARRRNQQCFKSCCALRTLKTCNKQNTYPRAKLLGSTFMAYLDTVSDILIMIAIFNLIGTVKSRQFWLFLSFVYILAPSLMHSYYVSNCEGWRDRSSDKKFLDIIINLAFLRPIVELVKSCQVSIDLEDPEIDDLKDDVRLAMNCTY